MADNGILGKILSTIDSTKRTVGLNLSGAVADPGAFANIVLSNLADTLQKGTSGDVNDFVDVFGFGGVTKVLYTRMDQVTKKPVVTFDGKTGIGQIPNNQDIGYFGFEKTMPVKEFQSLHAPITEYKQDTLDFLQKSAAEGKPFGQPMLYVDWNPKTMTWDAVDHEGRHRAEVARLLGGDNLEIPVHIKPTGGLRARDITDFMKNAPIRSESKVDLEKILGRVDDLLNSIKEGSTE